MNKIAVLSDNTFGTIQWLLHTYLRNVPRHEIKVIQTRRQIETRNNLYTIVSKREDCLGMEFNDYLISPEYVSLEDTVKTRIRK